MKNFERRALLWSVLAGLLAIAVFRPSQLPAQSTYGSIVGTITDASGAIAPNATVTVVDLATNETRTAKADASGNFSAVNLLPATYKVMVEAASFKRFVREPVQVAVGATVRIDAVMEAGAVDETVEVTTQAPLLQADSSSISQEIEGQTVQEMPLNGRNTMNLIALTAGVIPGDPPQAHPEGTRAPVTPTWSASATTRLAVTCRVQAPRISTAAVTPVCST